MAHRVRQVKFFVPAAGNWIAMFADERHPGEFGVKPVALWAYAQVEYGKGTLDDPEATSSTEWALLPVCSGSQGLLHPVDDPTYLGTLPRSSMSETGMVDRWRARALRWHKGRGGSRS